MSDLVYESVVHPNMLLALSALPDCGARDQVMKLVAEQANRIRDLEAAAENLLAYLAASDWIHPDKDGLAVIAALKATLNRTAEHE